MLPRLLLGTALAAASLCASFFAASCLYNSQAYLGSNCAPGTPEECCPCPVPEACPDGSPPIPDHCFPDAGSDADADIDGSQVNLCPSGTCTPKSPEDWQGPALLFYGQEFEAPSCPEDAPNLVFEGHPEPAPLACGTCSCEAPPGSCALPDTWTVSSAACNLPGVNTNFDPAANWDGTCTTNTSIAEGKLCGGSPCANSVTVSAPVIEEPPCIAQGGGDPVQDLPHFVAYDVFGTFGRACVREPWASCDDAAKVCVPPHPDFLACVHRVGDEPCPDGWPVRHLLYGEVDDQRTCTECACSNRSGATCSVFAAVYSDNGCGVLAGATVAKTGELEKCVELGQGDALMGKKAELLDYQPGTCLPAGAEAIGEVVLADARTFCCLKPSTI